MYTVKQVAEIVGTSAHTLRFYDNKGLFPNLSRDQNNNRVFSEQDLNWVHLIQCLRDTGMPLADIKHYVELSKQGDSTIEERYYILFKQKEKTEQEITNMQKRVDILNAKTDYYKEVLQAKKSDNWNPAKPSYNKCKEMSELIRKLSGNIF